jgi:hypothetical protein
MAAGMRTSAHSRAHRRAACGLRGGTHYRPDLFVFELLMTVEIGEAGMPTDDSLIDEIIKACNGDLRAAIRSVLAINEQRRAELNWLRESARKRSSQTIDSGPVIH